jgi:hypothetical protein
MIAKISTGSFVYGMVKYNHDKTKENKKGEVSAQLIGLNNIIISNLESSFETIVSDIITRNSKNNERVSKPNIHISLNFHKDDILSNEDILEIGKDYMEQMGYGEQPYAIYRHFDKEHPHIHIVTSQINSNGLKINDSHIYRKSTQLSRDLEEKYEITKALEKNAFFSKKNIHDAIYDHLEFGKHSKVAIMKRVLQEVLEDKPTNQKEFDKLLESFQMKRILSFDSNNEIQGHFFDLYPIDQIHTEEDKPVQKSKGIEGAELDISYSYQAIELLLLQNEKEKKAIQNQVMGRAYSVINPIVTNYKDTNKQERISNLILNLQKKGLELKIKRTQIGDNPNAIYGLIFKDIKTGHTYSASEIKLKTKDFLLSVDDDLKNTKENKIELTSSDKTVESIQREQVSSPEETIIGFLDAFSSLFKGGSTGSQEKAPVKKKKRRRNNN